MACSACAKRAMARKAVTNNTQPQQKQPVNRALAQGQQLRSRMRFTGR